MSETFEDRVDQRLTQIEQTLHNIDERTASLPALINRVLVLMGMLHERQLMGDFRHRTHETGEPN